MFCINVLLILTVIFFGTNGGKYGKNCDRIGINVYRDMKCTVQAVDCHNCPTKYDCPSIKNDNEHCYYKGHKYNPDESVNSTESFCDVGCFCNKEKYNPADFICAIVDCAEYFGIPPTEGCYRTYNLISCCSSGENCPKETPPHECIVDGNIYKEGQRFFPNTSCSMCICKKGFKGKYEAPYCVPRRCNVEIRDPTKIQQSCAPVYLNPTDLENKILCCPSTWICPNGKEVITGTATSDNKCKFGNKTLKLGQQIETELTDPETAQQLICKCNTPPLLTCLKKENIGILTC